MSTARITTFLADDNIIVREGVRALLGLEPDLKVVGVAAEYDERIAGAEAAHPDVVVTDIRMPPTFRSEGIDAAKQVRKRHPGTGIVVLSQFDDPSYAISLLEEGQAGYAYLLKDHVGEGNQLAAAVRAVASGGSLLDASIVRSLTRPAEAVGLDGDDEALLREIAQGRPVKAIAVSRGATPADIDGRIEALFLHLAESLSAGEVGALDHLKLLHRAIVDREEQGERLSRLLPDGVADALRADGRRVGETDELVVTVLMSDIRGYSAIAERTDPTTLAHQLHEHRAAMSDVIHARAGTVMQFVGDAVMAVFGAPTPSTDHADRAIAAAADMHKAQADVNESWRHDDRAAFGLGIGLSTGRVAAALLGSEDRLEYSLVGDTVNLTQRLQQWAQPGETILSDATVRAAASSVDVVALPAATVKGRTAPVVAHRMYSRVPA